MHVNFRFWFCVNIWNSLALKIKLKPKTPCNIYILNYDWSFLSCTVCLHSTTTCKLCIHHIHHNNKVDSGEFKVVERQYLQCKWPKRIHGFWGILKANKWKEKQGLGHMWWAMSPLRFPWMQFLTLDHTVTRNQTTRCAEGKHHSFSFN